MYCMNIGYVAIIDDYEGLVKIETNEKDVFLSSSDYQFRFNLGVYEENISNEQLSRLKNLQGVSPCALKRNQQAQKAWSRVFLFD